MKPMLHNPESPIYLSSSCTLTPFYDSSRSNSVISTSRDYPASWPTGWKQNLNRR
jgi:hypothetical protein